MKLPLFLFVFILISLTSISVQALSVDIPIPLNTSTFNVSNADKLDGFHASYFYPASNPSGYISSYTETDPVCMPYINNNTLARYNFDGYNFTGTGNFTTTGKISASQIFDTNITANRIVFTTTGGRFTSSNLFTWDTNYLRPYSQNGMEIGGADSSSSITSGYFIGGQDYVMYGTSDDDAMHFHNDVGGMAGVTFIFDTGKVWIKDSSTDGGILLGGSKEAWIYYDGLLYIDLPPASSINVDDADFITTGYGQFDTQVLTAKLNLGSNEIYTDAVTGDLVINPSAIGVNDIRMLGRTNYSGYNIIETGNVTPKTTNTYSIGSSVLRYLKGWFSGLDVVGDTLLNGNLNITGNLSVKRPYAMFSDNTTQVIGSALTPQVVNFSITEDNWEIMITGKQNITFLQQGDYLIEVSAIYNVDLPNKHIEFWVQKTNSSGQFVDVPRSNTKMELPTANIEIPLAVPFILDILTTDKIRFMTASDDAGSSIVYTGATAYSPETPSIIVTFTKISEITP